jgi:hypothetical protein
MSFVLLVLELAVCVQLLPFQSAISGGFAREVAWVPNAQSRTRVAVASVTFSTRRRQKPGSDPQF